MLTYQVLELPLRNRINLSAFKKLWTVRFVTGFTLITDPSSTASGFRKGVCGLGPSPFILFPWWLENIVSSVFMECETLLGKVILVDVLILKSTGVVMELGNLFSPIDAHCGQKQPGHFNEILKTKAHLAKYLKEKCYSDPNQQCSFK